MNHKQYCSSCICHRCQSISTPENPLKIDSAGFSFCKKCYCQHCQIPLQRILFYRKDSDSFPSCMNCVCCICCEANDVLEIEGNKYCAKHRCKECARVIDAISATNGGVCDVCRKSKEEM